MNSPTPLKRLAGGCLTGLSLLVSLTLLAAACGSGTHEGPGEPVLPPEFMTPVAAAQKAGLPIYWVGPQFEMEGRTSRIIGADWEEAEGVSSVRIEYEVEHESDSEDRGTLDLTLITYGPESWEMAKTGETPKTEGVTRRSVTVAGWSAELFSIPVGQWTNRVVIVSAPDAIIVAPANTTIAKGQRQVNLLVDSDRLLTVLENLRPYPH